MNNDDNGSESNPQQRRSTPKARSPYADRPYRVGKGKPPVEHQFRKGGPSPNKKGRPKGSTRANSLDKLLATRVVVGYKNGRAIRKPLREVIDHKLIELAAKGDLDAIKLIKDIQYRYEKSGLMGQPTVDEIIRQREEEEQKQAYAETLRQGIIDHLQTVASMKKLGLIEFVDGRERIAQWIIDELARREAEAKARKGLQVAPSNTLPDQPSAN